MVLNMGNEGHHVPVTAGPLQLMGQAVAVVWLGLGNLELGLRLGLGDLGLGLGDLGLRLGNLRLGLRLGLRLLLGNLLARQP